ncbi:MAG TPA: type II toxin-antitoxin system VapC family toxin [Acetobacteraceae bacterium]|nr:type II toxin-antitoxin system VapC family toxin [Acetobacteraceae bacterium]
MRFLLDTNIVSDLIRAPQGRAANRIRVIGEALVRTSIIVAAELRFGAHKRGSPKLTERLEAILGALEIVPLEAPADAVYGRIRARLEHMGVPIGGNDLLIAAQAIALGDTVVTDNEREFGRIEGLRVENWLGRS